MRFFLRIRVNLDKVSGNAFDISKTFSSAKQPEYSIPRLIVVLILLTRSNHHVSHRVADTLKKPKRTFLRALLAVFTP